MDLTLVGIDPSKGHSMDAAISILADFSCIFLQCLDHLLCPERKDMKQSLILFVKHKNIFNVLCGLLVKVKTWMQSIKYHRRLNVIKIAIFLNFLLLGTLSQAQSAQYLNLHKLESNHASATSFGSAVDISFDKAIVGANLNDRDQSVIYIFQKENNLWKQVTEISLGNSNFFDQSSISAAIDNSTAVVGLPWNDTNGKTAQGIVYVFEEKGSWQQVARLIPNDGQAEDLFGSSVAISGNTIIVGSQRSKTDSGIAKGAAYVFTKEGNNWQQKAKLQASTGKAFDDFGNAVAIDDDIAVVAAKGNEVNGETARGSVYVYKRQGGSWGLAKTLIAQDGKSGDRFGSAVAIDGETIVVGAESYTYGNQVSQGAVYVFKAQDNWLGTSNWEQDAKLIAKDGEGGDHFGSSVDINGNKIVIGAYLDNIDSNGYLQGSTYIFEEILGVWEQLDKLTAEDGTRGDNFGNSVSISSEAIVIGAHLADVNGEINQGTVYAFTAPLLQIAKVKKEAQPF